MQKKFWILFTVLTVLALLLAACGGGSTESTEPAGQPEGNESGGEPMTIDVDAGKALFLRSLLGSNPGCVTCHSLEPGVTLTGPSLDGIATRAGERVPGMSAEEYIRQSILDPNAYVVEDFVTGAMLAGWDKALSESDLNNLVAYLMTLK